MPPSPAPRSRALKALVGASLERPRTALSVWAAMVAIGAVGLTQLRIDTTIGSALNRSDESWRTYQQSTSRYGGELVNA